MLTNREAHEEAAGMNLYPEFFILNNIDPDGEYKESTTLKSLLSEVFADNGEHSHWRLIDCETGKLLWSEFPEEEFDG